MIAHLKVRTSGSGLTEFTHEVNTLLQANKIRDGLCTIMVQHTSASLVIQENADPSARRDLENWLNRLVPDRDPIYTHTTEGDDDMPAHIKAALTATTLSIPVESGHLALGTWQGVYLWEHRYLGSQRRLVLHVTA
ncbi:MAG: secondary thiamine-phosphate synthase enzyme YjbQ [Acidiferrobacterales bacterium]